MGTTHVTGRFCLFFVEIGAVFAWIACFEVFFYGYFFGHFVCMDLLARWWAEEGANFSS